MTDDDLCHTVDPADVNVALCGAVLTAHEWCTGPCPHTACPACPACPTCEAVIEDEA